MSQALAAAEQSLVTEGRGAHGKYVNFYREGEFWIVKSKDIRMQACYLATPYTHGLSATHQVAIGGPFLGGNVLSVGPLDEGSITWNRQPILTTCPSTFIIPGLITATYNGEGKVLDPANAHLQKHIVHLDLRLGVHVSSAGATASTWRSPCPRRPAASGATAATTMPRHGRQQGPGPAADRATSRPRTALSHPQRSSPGGHEGATSARRL